MDGRKVRITSCLILGDLLMCYSGRGLGKKETGICKPIRPKLKFDNHGVGFNPGDEYKNNWWEIMYNKTASSISVIIS